MKSADRKSFIHTIVWAGGGAALMLVVLLAYSTFARLLNPAPFFPHADLTIQHAGGPPVTLAVDVATTPKQHSYGLMFRRAMPERAGMIFIFDEEQVVDFWMKNTYIPLDMLFVRKDGVIVKIVTHTQPFSRTLIPSGEPVLGVIEINGGVAARLGIETGDKVIFPAFAASP